MAHKIQIIKLYQVPLHQKQKYIKILSIKLFLKIFNNNFVLDKMLLSFHNIASLKIIINYMHKKVKSSAINKINLEYV
jgi:hypothetical protein